MFFHPVPPFLRGCNQLVTVTTPFRITESRTFITFSHNNTTKKRRVTCKKISEGKKKIECVLECTSVCAHDKWLQLLKWIHLVLKNEYMLVG